MRGVFARLRQGTIQYEVRGWAAEASDPGPPILAMESTGNQPIHIAELSLGNRILLEQHSADRADSVSARGAWDGWFPGGVAQHELGLNGESGWVC